MVIIWIFVKIKFPRKYEKKNTFLRYIKRWREISNFDDEQICLDLKTCWWWKQMIKRNKQTQTTNFVNEIQTNSAKCRNDEQPTSRALIEIWHFAVVLFLCATFELNSFLNFQNARIHAQKFKWEFKWETNEINRIWCCCFLLFFFLL